MFSRNIGLISEEQQNLLEKASVTICGVGGMGGVCAEVLVRLGIGNLKIVDFDIFEETNLNRQIHSNSSTIGKKKVEVLKENFLSINPNLNIQAIPEAVSEENVDSIIEGSEFLVNGMDQMLPSIILERSARKKNITIVDAWLTPFASVFVVKPSSPHWEEYLKLPSLGKSISEITQSMVDQNLEKEIEHTFSFGTPYTYVERDTVKRVIEGKIPRPSLAPVVWLSGTMMANEVFKLVVGFPVTDHLGVFFDQYSNSIIKA